MDAHSVCIGMPRAINLPKQGMSTPVLHIHTDTGGLYVRVVQQPIPQCDHDAPDNVNGGGTPDKVPSCP
jgi:hypothetical protein